MVVQAHQTVELDFISEQKGLTLFHCYNQFHMDRGFMYLFEFI